MFKPCNLKYVYYTTRIIEHSCSDLTVKKWFHVYMYGHVIIIIAETQLREAQPKKRHLLSYFAKSAKSFCTFDTGNIFGGYSGSFLIEFKNTSSSLGGF